MNNSESFGIIKDLHAIRPFKDRVLVVVDKPKTKYDCKACQGRGHTNETCQYCMGTGFDKGKEKNGLCNECLVKGEVDRATGKVICPVCHGHKGLIAIPDDAKKPPLTGVVIAVGDECQYAKVAMPVIFTSYTGTEFNIEGVLMRIANERDLIGEYRQLKQTSTSGEISEVTHIEPEKVALG